jgi:SAM-dependent methyltransferase
MKIFDNYSNYYNLLYKDKDYSIEANYVRNLIKKYGVDVKTILDLGCGTGKHAKQLTEYEFTVTGIDQSEEMVRIAKEQNPTLDFFQGDIRTARLNKKFDTAVSLFHVMNYQTTNDDIITSFKTVNTHLKDNGIFIFDSWYGPAVLSDRPTVRVKRMENELIDVKRTSKPQLDLNSNRVNIKFDIEIKNKNTEKTETINEIHNIRYFFYPEIEFFLRTTGFKLLHVEEWMTGNDLDDKTWYCCFIAQKTSDH